MIAPNITSIGCLFLLHSSATYLVRIILSCLVLIIHWLSCSYSLPTKIVANQPVRISVIQSCLRMIIQLTVLSMSFIQSIIHCLWPYLYAESHIHIARTVNFQILYEWINILWFNIYENDSAVVVSAVMSLGYCLNLCLQRCLHSLAGS